MTHREEQIGVVGVRIHEIYNLWQRVFCRKATQTASAAAGRPCLHFASEGHRRMQAEIQTVLT